jgi:sigma-E factor negative regulatory protein RseC
MLKFKSMEEVGVIESIQGKTATVKIPKKSVCEGCQLGTCKPAEESMEIQAFNPVHAQVGQKVRVVIKPYAYLKGSVIVYGIPALSLIIGAISGKEIFSSYFSNLDTDTVSALFGFGALIISFLCIKIWSRTAGKKEHLKPVIEEILNDSKGSDRG